MFLPAGLLRYAQRSECFADAIMKHGSYNATITISSSKNFMERMNDVLYITFIVVEPLLQIGRVLYVFINISIT
jgi:hypothetical protein